MEDLGEPSTICEMCEIREIRYVHYMRHPDYPDVLGVGCICAENMEQDYRSPREREKRLQNAQRKRKNWLSRKGWRLSKKGNPTIRTDGYRITIYQLENRSWTGVIENLATGERHWARREYQTEDKAKMGALDGLLWLKERE